MNTAKTLDRLADFIGQKSTKPEALARALELTLIKATESHPSGQKAMRLLQSRIRTKSFESKLQGKDDEKNSAVGKKRGPGRPRKIPEAA